MEIELAWGLHDLQNFSEATKSLSHKRKKETETLTSILNICDEYNIKFTFDVVAHLFYTECTGEHSGPHPKNWFKRDPGTNIQSDPHFYAPDLIEMIRKSNTNHEICTHTFSHIPCGEVSKDVVNWELKRSKNIHKKKLDNGFISFVPPRHSLPPKDVLIDQGIEIIREPDDRTPTKSKIHTIIKDLFGTHPVRKPDIKEGLVETYSTFGGSLNAQHLPDGQQPPHPIYRVLPLDLRKYLHKRYLSKALHEANEQDSFAHFWTHLQDVSNEPQRELVQWFIKEVARYRNNRGAQIYTMAELNEIIRKNE